MTAVPTAGLIVKDVTVRALIVVTQIVVTQIVVTQIVPVRILAAEVAVARMATTGVPAVVLGANVGIGRAAPEVGARLPGVPTVRGGTGPARNGRGTALLALIRPVGTPGDPSARRTIGSGPPGPDRTDSGAERALTSKVRAVRGRGAPERTGPTRRGSVPGLTGAAPIVTALIGRVADGPATIGRVLLGPVRATPDRIDRVPIASDRASPDGIDRVPIAPVLVGSLTIGPGLMLVQARGPGSTTGARVVRPGEAAVTMVDREHVRALEDRSRAGVRPGIGVRMRKIFGRGFRTRGSTPR